MNIKLDVFGTAKTLLALTLLVLCSVVRAQESLDLTPVANVFGVAQMGSPVTNGGMDIAGNAYAGNLLGTSLTWAGAKFSFAAPGPNSAVSNKVIPLPAGKDASLILLATAVNGNQENQAFVVTYTDGSNTTITQSLSDWYTPQNYSGEFIALTMAYRINSAGSTNAGPFHLYAYNLALNPAKTVKSLTLPTNPSVVVVALDITPAPGAVSLATVDNVYGIGKLGTQVTGGGIDGSGDAFDTGLLGRSLTFAGRTFNLAAAGPDSAVTKKVISLPGIHGVSLNLLAVGVDGTQPNQTFIVTYTDGSKTTITQSLSDWYAPQHYSGEFDAATMPFIVESSGAEKRGPFNVYGYDFALNSSKILKSLELPANPHVVVLAVDVTPFVAIPLVATPIVHPLPGQYTGSVTISITDSTSGAVIRYTTDGSAPVATSTRYVNPFTISATTTVNILAIAPGFNDSVVLGAKYNIVALPTAAVPTFDPPSGVYAPYIYGPWTPSLLSLADATPGASIYYIPNEFSGPILYTGPIALNSSILGPNITAFATAPGYNSSANAPFASYTVGSLPSDEFYGGGYVFLYNPNKDSGYLCTSTPCSAPPATISCAYYKAVGAFVNVPASADPCTPGAGNTFQYGITQTYWNNNVSLPVIDTGGPIASATFGNAMDLNLTRVHVAAERASGYSTPATLSVAEVCNYPGTDFFHGIKTFNTPNGDQTAVDAAIAGSVYTNELACVAIDYGTQPNLMRFLVFGNTGQLLSRVDLDGRGAKQIPDACTACHGLTATSPTDTDYQHNYGGRFIPFDEGNMLFSSKPGLTQADQEGQILALNQIVLDTTLAQSGSVDNPFSDPITQLIIAWYGLKPNTLLLAGPKQNVGYIPDGIVQNGPYAVSVYGNVYAPLCRSCHVANGVTTYVPPQDSTDLLTVFANGHVCSPSTKGAALQVMPNSRVSFDRFWSSHAGLAPSQLYNDEFDLPNILSEFLTESQPGGPFTGTCNLN